MLRELAALLWLTVSTTWMLPPPQVSIEKTKKTFGTTKVMPLAARSSLQARRTIREAFEGLEKVISPSEAKDFNNTTLQNVQDAALEIESILAARQSLRNMRRLSPLFEGLKCYAETVEVLCNGTPYLPWIWAPIKLILKVSSDYTDAFERIIKAYSEIAESLPRFHIISDALRNSKEMQQVLAVFYADILTFHKEAYIFVRRSGWRILFLTSWGRFQRRFDSTLEDLQKHKKLIDDTASAINLSETVKMSENLQAWRQENLDKLKFLEDEQTAKQYQSIIGCLKIDETEQLAIFDAISSEGNKYDGTCDWVSRHIHIREWLKETPTTDFVWLHGIPGTGKSVIATQLVKFLQSSGKAMVIQHFCTYTHLSSVQYETILRSLLVQLMRTNSDLIAHAYAEFVIGKKLPTSQSLEQLLLAFGGAVSPMPSESRSIYLVIDGLDECEPDQQGRIANLLEKLRGLRSSASSVFKILLCSRRTQQLEKRLRKRTVQVVSMTNEKGSIEPAIRTYANQRLRAIRYRLFQMGLTDSDLRDISINIARKADGMFLWARLVLDYLSTNILSSRDEVRGAVDMLPAKLGEFYARILAQLTSRFDQRSVERLRSTLGWIAFAKRPLTRAEMRSALAFSWGDHMVEEAVPRHIFEFGAPLLEEHPDTTFSFVHISLKEYLQTPGCILFLDRSAATREHATATITCLVSGFWIFAEQLADDNRILRIVKGIHGLHIYSNQFWLECFLDTVSTSRGLVHGSPLHQVAQALANSLRLQPSTRTSSTSGNAESTASEDNRLQYLKEHDAIYEMARRELGERVARAKSQMTDNGGTPTAPVRCPPNDLQSLLLAIQSSIKDILALTSISGISPEDLDRFKKEFRTSAFTCRFPNCPRTTLGFPDEKAKSEHETRHTQRIDCTVVGCQYPPFVSARALRDHVSKCHQPQNTIRKRIRRASGGSLSLGVEMQKRTALSLPDPLQGVNFSALDSDVEFAEQVTDDWFPLGNFPTSSYFH
ncbi:hypothetical protein GE21DRAFT_2385 [Neurospora crassa]|uniref:NACHT domain-containing protein n=1 Tax=Neurospora crassa (strain ATCC 24698 / 74-OR23-1A / CBS 708.71 / DSM 1257 / FGSC 987) TaxID=367110 RepID=V5IR87_NEUCR|nr:NACHT domain-containing protein [Neurospora crassa OR74A]ESA44365.1 NACHT domain-containing protein [Neurospora crassa OR74A]KHE89316.1 hypothetical protein GE21DRAFT_2385 [Neurospora crassa]|eukprot:XP_011393433.1 NACHT domain-containing protein [Neurospora crassa OR74A]